MPNNHPRLSGQLVPQLSREHRTRVDEENVLPVKVAASNSTDSRRANSRKMRTVRGAFHPLPPKCSRASNPESITTPLMRHASPRSSRRPEPSERRSFRPLTRNERHTSESNRTYLQSTQPDTHESVWPGRSLAYIPRRRHTPRFALTDPMSRPRQPSRRHAAHCALQPSTPRYTLTSKTLVANTPLTCLLRRRAREAGAPTSPRHSHTSSKSRQSEAIHFRRIRCSYQTHSQTNGLRLSPLPLLRTPHSTLP
jgi:hypothetical protein